MDASPLPSELQLRALYGRYSHWWSPPTPSSNTTMEAPSHKPSLTSLCALVVQFEASTREDLRVGFAPSLELPTASDEVTRTERHETPHLDWKYEVAVGTSGNTELVWRKSASGRDLEVDLARVFTGRTCSAQEFVPYWIVVNVQKHLLSIGVGAHVGQDVLSTVHDHDFVRVTQLSFTSWDQPVAIRGIQAHGVYDGQKEALAAANVAAYPLPRPMVRADPLGKTDLLTPDQHQQYETEYTAAKRRAERFGTLFVPPDAKKFVDSREVRKFQRTGTLVAGFSTGLDLTSEAEQSKRAQRTKRFDTPQVAIAYTAETARALAFGLTQEAWTERQDDLEKLRARAQKFGLSAMDDRSQVTRTDLEPANAKVQRDRCDVHFSVVKGHAVPFRDDALHMYSLDPQFQQIRTRDVMTYFIHFAPAYVEWINDSSCTIVFQDKMNAARALLALGREIPRQTLMPMEPKVKRDDTPGARGNEDMVDATDVCDDAAMAIKDTEAKDVDFNRSQWYLSTPIGSRTHPSDKKWRVLLRKATDDDFPPEKLPKTALYHARGSHRQDARRPRRRRRNDREYGSFSQRRGADSRPRPYGAVYEDRRGEEPSTCRRRTRDSGNPLNRIRVNADGSMNIVREQQAVAVAKEVTCKAPSAVE